MVTAHTVVGVQHQQWTVWFNSVDTDIIFWAGIQLLDGQQEAPIVTVLYSRNTPQSFSQGTRLYTFPRLTKHVYTSLAGSQNFSKICWRVEICSVVLRARRKPHKVSPGFASIFSPYLFVTNLACTLPGRLSKEIPRKLVHSLMSPLLCMGMISLPIFRFLPKRHDTWQTRVSQTIRRSKFR